MAKRTRKPIKEGKLSVVPASQYNSMCDQVVAAKAHVAELTQKLDDSTAAHAEKDKHLKTLTDRVLELERERDELLELVAVLNGDGGQHHGKVGTEQAVVDGLENFYNTLKELDEANNLLDEGLNYGVGKEYFLRVATHLKPKSADLGLKGQKGESRVAWLERHIQKAINEIDQGQGNFNGVLPEDTADAIRDILVDGKDRQGES